MDSLEMEFDIMFVVTDPSSAYKIVDKRATGKTLRLMLIAKETNAVFVCYKPHIMKEKAADYGLTDIDFVSYEDFFFNDEVSQKYKFRNVVIDEVALFVAKLTAETNGSTLKGLTMSIED